MVRMEKDLFLSILGATVKFEESSLELLVGRVVKGVKGTAMADAQGYPTNMLTKLHLIEIGENVD